MSAQLKAFQGPDVQLLLDRIRTELGPGVKIDGAERIRVGGVMGFSSKEHYRVVVEIPDVTGEAGSAAPPLPAPPPEPPAVADPAPGLTTAEANGGTATNGTTGSWPASPDAGTAGAMGSDNRYLDDHSYRHAAPDHLDETPTPDIGAVPEVDRADSSPVDVFPTDLPPLDVSPAVVSSENGKVDAWYDIGLGPPTPAASNGPGPDPHGLLADALRRVGLDNAWAGSISESVGGGGDLRSLLLHMFAELPPAPPVPRRAGSLLVVVGEGATARRLAAALADEIGGDSAAVPFASCQAGAHVFATGKLLVRSAEDAAELAPVWRRDHAAVVVVDASVTSTERSWASDMIAAMRPTAVWGVVDSTCKTEDVTEWARCLGGFDALALDNFNFTASPVAALGVGIPVARIDGQPATASRWVGSVLERVNSCT